MMHLELRRIGRKRIPFLIGPCLWLGLALRLTAGPLDQWVWRNPQPFCPQLQSVTHGGGLWLVLGNVGLVATSVDGVGWDLASFGTNSVQTFGAYGDGQYVAASSRGIFHSADAHNWSAAGSGGSLNDICFGNGLFVGLTFGSTIWRSLNGSNWVSATPDFVMQFSRISFANGRFFGLGTESGSPAYYTSTDGTNWTGPNSLGTNAIQKVLFGNGVYVSLNPVLSGTNVWSEFRTSTNGTTWSPAVILPNTYVTDGVFANGQFVAVDEAGGVLFSTDGVTWQEQAVPELFGATRVDWDGRLLVATGIMGRIVSSPDAVTWTRRTTGPQNSLVGIIHTNGLLVAVGGNLYDPYAHSTVITSTNGRDWVEHDPGTSNSLTSATFANGQYVAVGANGAIVTSTNAMTWAAVASPTTNLLYSVACGAGQFVAVGGVANRATILNSSDGMNWTVQTNATNYGILYAVTFAQGRFVAVGQTNTAKQATVLTSADGLAWTPVTGVVSNTLRAVGFGNGLYVAVGDIGTIVNSGDGLTWTNVSPGGVLSWRGVAYGSGYYVTFASVPSYAYSSNAVNWTLSSSLRTLTQQPFYGIVSGDNSFFLAGYEGEVLESGPFNAPAPEVTLGLRQGAQTFLSFTGPENQGYEIQASDSLPGSWEPILTVTNVSATTTLPVNPGTNGASQFYRVRLLN